MGEIDSKGEPYYFDGDWAVVEAAIERIKTYDSDQPFYLYLQQKPTLIPLRACNNRGACLNLCIAIKE